MRPACFRERRCCETAPCVTPLPRVRSATLISSDFTMRSKTARLVGSASVRMMDPRAAARFMENTLADTNATTSARSAPLLRAADRLAVDRDLVDPELAGRLVAVGLPAEPQ